MDDYRQNGSVSAHSPTVAERDRYMRFAKVVMPYLSDALSLAQCLADTPPATDDLLQDAFMRAILTIDDFVDGNARAWVLSNVFAAWLNRSTDPSFDGEALLASKEAHTGSGSAGRDDDPARAMLEQTLTALPAVFRATMLLRKQGHSYKKIAAITGVPLGTVMSRLARARRHLKQAADNRQI